MRFTTKVKPRTADSSFSQKIWKPFGLTSSFVTDFHTPACFCNQSFKGILTFCADILNYSKISKYLFNF